ncbi:hypothetical protein BDZ89DRAFT_1114717 [Hymenopellis radicata]|nr:hypothetical protein BDZ89DRAFT_1114717 [Hymenopellis radicata]
MPALISKGDADWAIGSVIETRVNFGAYAGCSVLGEKEDAPQEWHGSGNIVVFLYSRVHTPQVFMRSEHPRAMARGQSAGHEDGVGMMVEREGNGGGSGGNGGDSGGSGGGRHVLLCSHPPLHHICLFIASASPSHPPLHRILLSIVSLSSWSSLGPLPRSCPCYCHRDSSSTPGTEPERESAPYRLPDNRQSSGSDNRHSLGGRSRRGGLMRPGDDFKSSPIDADSKSSADCIDTDLKSSANSIVADLQSSNGSWWWEELKEICPIARLRVASGLGPSRRIWRNCCV